MTTETMTSTFETTTTQAPAFPGGVSRAPRVLLRLEGAIMLVGAVAAYAHLGAGWALFAMLFLLPDLQVSATSEGPASARLPTTRPTATSAPRCSLRPRSRSRRRRCCRSR